MSLLIYALRQAGLERRSFLRQAQDERDGRAQDEQGRRAQDEQGRRAGETTSHSTKLPKNGSQVAGYQAEWGLKGL